MKASWVVPAIFSILPLLLIAIFLWKGADFVGGPDFIPTTSPPAEGLSSAEGADGNFDALKDGSDQVIAMLSTIVFGLFILLGFSVQFGLSKVAVADLSIAIFGGLFLTAAFISLYFGYAARMQALEFISDGYADFGPVIRTVGIQALFAALAVPSAFFILVRTLLKSVKNVGLGENG